MRIAVAGLVTALILGASYLATSHRGSDLGSRSQEKQFEAPPVYVAAAAAGRLFDGAVHDDPDDHSPTTMACRELIATGLVKGCVPRTSGPGFVGERIGLVSTQGTMDGSIVRMTGSIPIEELVAKTVASRDSGRACEVVGSPGSRLIAVLGPSSRCEDVPRVQEALDHQSRVTMLACLKLVSAKLVAGCALWAPALGGMSGEVTPFVDKDGQEGGGIVLPGREPNFAHSLMVARSSNRDRPCAVVGSEVSRMVAVLSPAMSCDDAPRVKNVLDEFASHDR